ncbi:MAG: hypothetical protein Q7S27_01560 [Nanoarchaeota archaeon]|nr:hypothetical protein [Nanoarchaeota archaeon]
MVECKTISLEELGYDRGEVLEILGFKSFFEYKCGQKINEESSALLFRRFEGEWMNAAGWYIVVNRHYKNLGKPISEREIVEELEDNLEHYMDERIINY